MRMGVSSRALLLTPLSVGPSLVFLKAIFPGWINSLSGFLWSHFNARVDMLSDQFFCLSQDISIRRCLVNVRYHNFFFFSPF